jgi:hypothetical protein
MHPQLEALLEIQDLKTQRRELGETASRDVQEAVFGLSTEDALATLDEKIAEMEQALHPQVRSRYLRMSASSPRVVVPASGAPATAASCQDPHRPRLRRGPERGSALVPELRAVPVSDRLKSSAKCSVPSACY